MAIRKKTYRQDHEDHYRPRQDHEDHYRPQPAALGYTTSFKTSDHFRVILHNLVILVVLVVLVVLVILVVLAI